MHSFRSSLTTLVLLLVCPLLTFGGTMERNFAEYLKSVSPDEFVSALVIMSDQANIDVLDAKLREENATLAVRHKKVLGALHSAANRSQGGILDYLSARKSEGSVKGYTPYWIMNLIVVLAERAEIEGIAARADVEIVESNFKVSLIKPVGDKQIKDPLKGIGVTPGLRAINAPRVWYELEITGLGKLIGNLDTGVDGSHPALTDRWRGNHEPWQECWRDAVGYGTTYPVDYNAHGTHVMGTLCGLGAASVDTIGVAWEAEWIADNAIDQTSGPEIDNDILDAFQWFADPDGDPNTTDDIPDVVENSWGVDHRFPGYQDCDYRWQAVIENCEAAGVVCVFSAGNEGPASQTLRSPANICNTPTTNFSVGAVNATHYEFPYPIADFSSRGPSDCDGVSIKPEVVAPGVEVYSSVPGGGYEQVTWDGTSMAGPHVAGVVALMRQVSPNLDVATIKEILMNTAVDLGSAGEDNDYGFGIIDAYQAVVGAMSVDFTELEEFGTGDSRGIAWADYDNDGDIDLAVTNYDAQNKLYRNDGNGLFLEFDEFGAGYGGAIAWGDYDNDGDKDLAVTNYWEEQNKLYKNNGDGTFTELDKFGSQRGLALAWGDYDNDGDLDLVVGNFGGGPSIDPRTKLHRNELYANGYSYPDSFTEITEFGARELSMAWGDFDHDGDVDLCATCYNRVTTLYRNNYPETTFSDFAELAYDGQDVAWGDYDNDGDLDLGVVKGRDEQNKLYVNNYPDTTFTEIDQFGLGSSNSLAWGDFDNDGDLDLAVGAFHNRLYTNNRPDLTFSESRRFGSEPSRKVIWGDYDNDGDIDLAVTIYGQNKLFRNKRNNLDYIKIRAVGRNRLSNITSYSNRDAIGAKVTVYQQAKGSLLGFREISGSNGSSKEAHFGVPAGNTYDVKVYWPTSGITMDTMVVAPAVITVWEYCRGDANGDKVVNVGDVTALIDYLYRGGAAPDPYSSGDANADGFVNVGDVVYLITYLYQGGPPPPPPSCP